METAMITLTITMKVPHLIHIVYHHNNSFKVTDHKPSTNQMADVDWLKHETQARFHGTESGVSIF